MKNICHIRKIFHSRSVSTPSTPPSWRRESRESRSRDCSWRRRGTQSERGDMSARSSRDSSTVRDKTVSNRWSWYRDPNTPAPDTSIMSASCHLPSSSDTDHSTPASSVSTIKSTNSYLSYRQPYMGWRSLERLKLSGNSILSPDQRLAASLLNQVTH